MGGGLRSRRHQSQPGAAFCASAPVRRAGGRARRCLFRQAGRGDVAAAVAGQVSAGFPGADPGHPARRPRPRPVLLSWRVPTIELDPAGALAWLATVADGGADGIRCGASLRYLAGLAAFAGELVERGRVLPTVVRDETGPLACWRPAVQGPDVVAFGALVTAMPPVCRAELGREDAHDLVADALHGTHRRRSAGSPGPGSTWCRRGAAAVRDACPQSRRGWRRSPRPTAGSTPTMTSSARSSASCGRGRRSAPAGSARLGPPSGLSEVEIRRPSRSDGLRRLAAGVPAAVHPGPQSARAGRPGVVG